MCTSSHQPAILTYSQSWKVSSASDISWHSSSTSIGFSWQTLTSCSMPSRPILRPSSLVADEWRKTCKIDFRDAGPICRMLVLHGVFSILPRVLVMRTLISLNILSFLNEGFFKSWVKIWEKWKFEKGVIEGVVCGRFGSAFFYPLYSEKF